ARSTRSVQPITGNSSRCWKGAPGSFSRRGAVKPIAKRRSKQTRKRPSAISHWNRLPRRVPAARACVATRPRCTKSGSRSRTEDRRPALPDFLHHGVTPGQLFALRDRVKSVREMIAPPFVLRPHRVRMRGGDRLEAGGVARKRQGGHELHRQRRLRALERLAQIVERETAAAPRQGHVGCTARASPGVALGARLRFFTRPNAID